jgi:hypothetical protein
LTLKTRGDEHIAGTGDAIMADQRTSAPSQPDASEEQHEEGKLSQEPLADVAGGWGCGVIGAPPPTPAG